MRVDQCLIDLDTFAIKIYSFSLLYILVLVEFHLQAHIFHQTQKDSFIKLFIQNHYGSTFLNSKANRKYCNFKTLLL